MTFDSANFNKVDAGLFSTSPGAYSYYTTDTLATAIASAYFNNAVSLLRKFDRIDIEASDDRGRFYVSSTTAATPVTVATYAVNDIQPNTIVNADINTAAGIVSSKFALAQGSVILGSATGIGSDLDASTDTAILIGNGTTATMNVLSGDVTMSNAGVVTIAAGAVESSMLAVPKIRASIRHTWAGGAATTDTVTLTGVAATDIIHVTTNANSGVGAVVSAERSGVDSILVTMSANMADGDILSVTAIQVV